ncbi:GMP synthase - glutamine amidotransferase domain [Shewanella sediminis HAW-EB3]|uniref:GMP synthase-glutamine amidotransferase domain n=1 Tax=Shewanella sediminis (strain HAW-EB3) TaxID=425104 RepID=A8FWB3_SHESH|nr:GMP synthase [Shewanella sediminis]ABV37136.1 GMP synthase - glutamine amidotransferase domain [Shewanella sediminis HAW-EB3]
MIIGILQCDDVRESLRDRHGNYPEMFTALFGSVDAKIGFKVYRVTEGVYPESIDECDVYITTGSRYSVNDDAPWIAEFQAFITQLYLTKKKFIGICFGHQMMAKALGGEVVTSPKGWGIGVMITTIKHRPTWMEMDAQQLALVVSHRDQVTKMPTGSVLIAGSEFCPCYMMQLNDHFLGIQGHPEFSKSYAKDLMMARRDIIPAQRIKSGIESLSLVVDDELVSRILLSFIR